MNKNLINYIRNLSENDKKTLSQKALKTTEEVGELAKAILPFDNADGTKHRFVDKQHILDGVVDVFLTSISIAYSLGFTDEEIESHIIKKAEKWQLIQNKESKINSNIPFEIHITIERPDDIDNFKDVCKQLEVKPIVLDLDSVMLDVMTSSKHFGNNAEAILEVERISNGLIQNNFKVIRKKIETVPWHPAAPSNKDDIMPGDCYFESHLQIITTEERKTELEPISKNNNSHLSRNFFKKNNDGTYIIMITKRSYNGTYEEFLNELEDLKTELKIHKFEYEKEIVEFSIYDTKISHDFLWLEKK